jgi:predicted dehydrogenase
VRERADVGGMRIGVLGAARIVPLALLQPARAIGGVRVTAIAARDPGRARAFALKHDIPTVHGDYESLLADASIDAIYNPLPAALHGHWTLQALDAGKHVLCEKPFTANATEARAVADTARHSGLVVMEAFHYRYHPLADRIIDIARSGEIGELIRLSATFCFPIPPGRNIRWQEQLGGGATMDIGCYPIQLLRHITGQEPTVTWAIAKAVSPNVDRFLKAQVAFPSGATGELTAALWSARLLSSTLTMTGTRGSLRVLSPYHPQVFHHFVVRTADGRRRERFSRLATYQYQLEAFRAAVQDGTPIITGPDDAVANMTVIDAAYRAAGMRPRQPLDPNEFHAT